jgi:hypothetical protein
MDPQWSHITPTPAALFPSSLEDLGIDYPKLDILDWLDRIVHYRNNLPALSAVHLHCAGCRGDNYKDMALEAHAHPVHANLRSIDVAFQIAYRKRDWQKSWDDYDLKTLENLPWLVSFGSACTGNLSSWRPCRFQLMLKIMQGSKSNHHAAFMRRKRQTKT